MASFPYTRDPQTGLTSATKYVRQSNMAGPCITQGVLLNETAKFYVFTSKYDGRTRKLAKGWKNHIEPCSCCRDHERTAYPRGYED